MLEKFNLVGKRFGRLVVLKRVESRRRHDTSWLCRCDCGTETVKSGCDLRSGDSKSCGCLRHELMTLNLKDKRFSRLVAKELVGFDKRRSALWKCICDCGNETTVSASALTTGNTKSCGCLVSDVQRMRMIEYNTRYTDEESKDIASRLTGMKCRCYNKNYPGYKDYGGRGITVCDEWLNDTNKFIEWSKTNGYRHDLSIDRIDYNKGYSPDNCRWVDSVVQNNNRRNNRLICIRNVSKSVAQWINILKLPKYWHKEIYSNPDHIIKRIFIDRVEVIIRELHMENERDLNVILAAYAKETT